MSLFVDGIDLDRISLNAAAGVLRLGRSMIQWGSASSTDDGAQAFSFNVDFPTACGTVVVQRKGANNKNILPPVSNTKSGFTINRNDEIDGSWPFDWYAIGY